MVTALHREFSASPSIKWSLIAGIYLFVCGIVTVVLLDEILSLLADVIGLPATYALIVCAAPILLIGSDTWWAVVERRDAYTYLFGAVAGLLTAVLTGLLWTAQFVGVWGVEMLMTPMVSVLVLFVFGITVLAGALTGVPLMYARRHVAPSPAA